MSSDSRRETVRASLLTLPAEVRNQIYQYVFEPVHAAVPSAVLDEPDAFAVALQLQRAKPEPDKHRGHGGAAHQLRVLATCRQIYAEAHLLALSVTPFHLAGEVAYPDIFDMRSRSLSAAKLAAIRHVTLTARIGHLRALNEAWAGLPFGHVSLALDTLVIVPTRPSLCTNAYAEIADLSQSHTLAYVFCETLKGLRNVKCLEVRNHGCFNELVWRLVYRSLVYRMYRWGGGKCGIRFQCSEAPADGHHWFRAYLKDGEGMNEVGQEVKRLVGLTGEMPDAHPPGVGP